MQVGRYIVVMRAALQRPRAACITAIVTDIDQDVTDDIYNVVGQILFCIFNCCQLAFVCCRLELG